MTTTEKPITRESPLHINGRPVIVQLEGRVLRFRLKGARNHPWLTLPVEAAYYAAARGHYCNGQ